MISPAATRKLHVTHVVCIAVLRDVLFAGELYQLCHKTPVVEAPWRNPLGSGELQRHDSIHRQRVESQAHHEPIEGQEQKYSI